ncbi:hypothetical protein E6P09_16605 (plasmid) [Haloferax mediterranei ATCC 33500]|uniref:Secreted glycoprotein n=1 Tax=Haloferax mediterranei (strain ATCC 33500 / DSM 1411 / JCM 8866 / NBRC 14739 / NCIMB 2177 / R-4) TaxID=523841 RepID=I3RAX2_HALMT|nr:hypothetical protein [Haloferax mediterranei]AFK21382.1 hypothetical protein HFX_6259 [Haloferax mediterranei ATCC 33500]AHZ24543.1 hypothetical protein BM92_16685 [Haloferax mediterranei ATCC 33500]ELZ97295.1 hypothetical protein C439_18273 [Haloferax mediterranei ATCC 33500]MDX5990403.1 hypothetical protein [Haloferax mediterranei ATCC 33500]QCQ76940.1 hypothetical protein E6P09_16605 [Haloferax mediterranei ATCC 33500]
MTDRATTIALNYVMLLGVVSILVSTLVFGVGGLVTDQQERGVRSQLDVVGNRLANDLTTVDGLASQTGSSVSLRSDLPDRAVGSRYTITVSPIGGDLYQLTLQSSDPDVVVRVRFQSQTPIESGTVRGGPVDIEYDSGTSEGVVLRD